MIEARKSRDARSRGVEVKVVVPGPFHNKPAVRRASMQSR